MEESRSNSSSRKKAGLNGSARAAKKPSIKSAPSAGDDTPKIGGAIKAQQLREDLGVIVSAIVNLPRYRHLPIGQIADLFIVPLRLGRISVARVSRAKDADNSSAIAGFVIWASVSESVSNKIAEQIKAGVFPIQLSNAEWTSGNNVWLLDVVASNRKVATAVVAGVIQSVGGKKIRFHPFIRRLIDTGLAREADSDLGKSAGSADEVSGRLK